MVSIAPSVSIIIPVRRLTPELRECLAYIAQLHPPPVEVMVVSDEPIMPLEGFPTHFLHAPGTPAEKRDTAAARARGEILAFLDDDAYPPPDWLVHALPPFADPRVAAVGGPAVTPSHDPLWAHVSGAVFTSWFGSGPAAMRYWPTGRTRSLDDWPSVNLLVRRGLYRTIGGFGTTTWPGEDTKLCLEIVRRGNVILYVPQAVVYHHRATSPLKHLRQVARYGLHRGYFAKRYPETSRRLSYFLPSLGTVVLASGVLLTAVLPSSHRALALAGLAVLGVLLSAALRESFRMRRWYLVLLMPPLLLLTHIAYGSAFLRGLLSPELKRYQRTTR